MCAALLAALPSATAAQMGPPSEQFIKAVSKAEGDKAPLAQAGSDAT
jgi:hypothetical protein